MTANEIRSGSRWRAGAGDPEQVRRVQIALNGAIHVLRDRVELAIKPPEARAAGRAALR
jgi:hypothetical protein